MKKSDTRRNKPLRIMFLAYRDWAIKAIDESVKDSNVEILGIIHDEEEYKKIIQVISEDDIDFLILVGWSWIIEADVLRKFRCIGMHPSDLPMYRGGSPIQHQIIDGIEHTKISLMEISPEGIDVGDIWLKEDWDLSGQDMKSILDSLSESTTRILKKFYNEYDTIIPQKQELSKGSYRTRRKPEDSKLDLSRMTLKEVYDHIRALGDPYPNAYLEDEEGNRLLLKAAEYIPAE